MKLLKVTILLCFLSASLIQAQPELSQGKFADVYLPVADTALNVFFGEWHYEANNLNIYKEAIECMSADKLLPYVFLELGPAQAFLMNLVIAKAPNCTKVRKNILRYSYMDELTTIIEKNFDHIRIIGYDYDKDAQYCLGALEYIVLDRFPDSLHNKLLKQIYFNYDTLDYSHPTNSDFSGDRMIIKCAKRFILDIQKSQPEKFLSHDTLQIMNSIIRSFHEYCCLTYGDCEELKETISRIHIIEPMRYRELRMYDNLACAFDSMPNTRKLIICGRDHLKRRITLDGENYNTFSSGLKLAYGSELFLSVGICYNKHYERELLDNICRSNRIKQKGDELITTYNQQYLKNDCHLNPAIRKYFTEYAPMVDYFTFCQSTPGSNFIMNYRWR